MPGNKSEKRLLKIALRQATKEKPVRFYVGSCPDYSHNGEIYTHEGLGDGVPFLTQIHLQTDSYILGVLEENKIPYQFVVMIADVEAEDEIFCQRFTNGDKQEFMKRCHKSQERTTQLFKDLRLDRKLKSSSFFEEFGRERFMYFQEAYQKVLTQRISIDGSFNMRVTGDLIARREMYRHMYPGISDQDFLIQRTLRTMAQYLALGRLIGEKTNECFPMIIVHPTRNKGVFNERNRFLLPGDEPRPQPTIPIFEMKRRVY